MPPANILPGRMRYVAFLIPALLLLAACGGGAPRGLKKGETLYVIATTPHLASIAMAIGGANAQVESLVPPNSSAHDYELTIADRRRLEAAHLLLHNGLELEHFEVAKTAGAARIVAVDCSATIPKEWLIESEEEEGNEEAGHNHAHDHGTYNPHVWLSTEGAIYQAQAVCDAMAKADPAKAELYRSALEELKKRLTALRDEYQPKVKALNRRNFVSNHDAFPYFAREYALKQVGVIQRTPGVDPTIEERRQLETVLHRRGAHAIFLEPGYDDAASRAVAESAGLPIATLDPFDVGTPSADGLEKVLRGNLDTVLKTLGR